MLCQALLQGCNVTGGGWLGLLLSLHKVNFFVVQRHTACYKGNCCSAQGLLPTFLSINTPAPLPQASQCQPTTGGCSV